MQVLWCTNPNHLIKNVNSTVSFYNIKNIAFNCNLFTHARIIQVYLVDQSNGIKHKMDSRGKRIPLSDDKLQF